MSASNYDEILSLIAFGAAIKACFESKYGVIKPGDTITVRLEALGGSIGIQTARRAAKGLPALEIELPALPSFTIQ